MFRDFAMDPPLPKYSVSSRSMQASVFTFIFPPGAQSCENRNRAANVCVYLLAGGRDATNWHRVHHAQFRRIKWSESDRFSNLSSSPAAAPQIQTEFEIANVDSTPRP